MIEIKPHIAPKAVVAVPGSKSYTHRILIGCALAHGVSRVENPLRSEDAMLTHHALNCFGVKTDDDGNTITVHGTGGSLEPYDEPIHLGNSGTSIRLLTAVAALGSGPYVLTGTPRLCERPIGDLLDGLVQAGIKAESVNGTGCPPVRIVGAPVPGGRVELKCGISSQFLSGMLLIAPYTENGLDIHVVEGPVSRPYIDMTVDVMKRLGVSVERKGYERFRVSGGSSYRSGDYMVEPDASNASYFFAAAAVTGSTVTVKGIHETSGQGDVRLVRIFEQMGCHVSSDAQGLTVTGGNLRAVDADLSDMPDMVPTLAVTAAFAEGITTIRNVAHLKAKESDRLAAMTNELSKLGVDIKDTGDGLIIHGKTAKNGAVIKTYDDHRIAMSMAVAGLVVPGIRISDEHCVEKSFPNFWEVLDTLYQS